MALDPCVARADPRPGPGGDGRGCSEGPRRGPGQAFPPRAAGRPCGFPLQMLDAVTRSPCSSGGPEGPRASRLGFASTWGPLPDGQAARPWGDPCPSGGLPWGEGLCRPPEVPLLQLECPASSVLSPGRPAWGHGEGLFPVRLFRPLPAVFAGSSAPFNCPRLPGPCVTQTGLPSSHSSACL